MKIAFFSNFLNHHQLPLCQELFDRTSGQFTFVAFEPVPAERLAMGYDDMNHTSFVLRAYESTAAMQQAAQLAQDCDVLILGSAPIHFVKQRARLNKLTFLFSERIHRDGWYKAFSPHELYRTYYTFSMFARHPVYLLASSAYAPFDYALHGSFLGKSFRWGYFPKAGSDDASALLAQKSFARGGPLSLLWAARLLPLKHPEAALHAAAALRDAGINFTLTILGSGEQESAVRARIRQLQLADQVRLVGSVPFEEVRHYMQKSDIFLFTSDYNEGWGAVVNEAMASGCAVVASHAAGSVPFLLQDGHNGLIYRNGDQMSLNAAILALARDPARCAAMGRNAMASIADTWNAATAAERLLVLCSRLQNNQSSPFATGPCSSVPAIPQWKMYRYCKEVSSL